MFIRQIAPKSELDFGKENSNYCSTIGATMLFIFMYSPKIDKHTPKIYRISRAVGKPMTKVADDLISFGYKHLKSIYENIDDSEIEIILSVEHDPNFMRNR
jgi:hypothetical protein